MSGTKQVASANWHALQKTLKTSSHPRKRRKLDHAESSAKSPNIAPLDPPVSAASTTVDALRSMVHGSLTYTPLQTTPGRYLAIDCEMVGIGIDGTESSLARVSLVNWYGAIQLDVFVQQRERVVDYRTKWSGIRQKDMARAKPFGQVQKQVSDLIQDRILIGHAVHNDLKALLLSHPRPLLRDTQVYARKFKLTRSKYIALRTLVKDQIGVTIQEGEHSSVTDARATMAIYRLHKKEWEKDARPIVAPIAKKQATPDTTLVPKKRTRGADEAQEPVILSPPLSDDQLTNPTNSPPSPCNKPPSNQPKPQKQSKKRFTKISSGLSTIVKHRVPGDTSRLPSRPTRTTSTSSLASGKSGENKAWWTELPSVGRSGTSAG